MRKLPFAMAALIVIAFCSLVLAQTNLVGPPLDLEFGMTYAELKSTLKERDINVDKPKEKKEWKLPDGFKVSEVGKYKVLDRKTDDNFAVFNADGELCAFIIRFRWSGSNAFKDEEKFWTQDLQKAVVGKYSGEGFKQHQDPDMDGMVPEVAFRDEVGNEIAVYREKGTPSSILGSIPVAVTTLTYYNEEILRETRKQQKETDDL
ncbi:MAG TPA: hypothetical protein VM118_09215 [Acidobacteriota bacterium]|nr:hypothetical protein [Acidobacteriota bacterium]